MCYTHKEPSQWKGIKKRMMEGVRNFSPSIVELAAMQVLNDVLSVVMNQYTLIT